jgi:hypothetical protein
MVLESGRMSKKDGGGKQREKDVSSLYKELQTHKQNEDYEKAIKVRFSLVFNQFLVRFSPLSVGISCTVRDRAVCSTCTNDKR